MKQILMWLGGSIFMIAGCVDIEGPTLPPLAASDIFSEFRFSTEAMLIKPGDTLQLKLIALSADGSPISLNPQKIRWMSGDSVRLPIDIDGRITPKTMIANDVSVKAEYTHGLTTRVANLIVTVTSDETMATSLKMVALDSNRVGAGMVAVLQGDTIPLPRIRLDLYEGATRIQSGAKLPVMIPAPYTAAYSVKGGPDQEPVYMITNGGSGIGKFWVRVSVNLHGVEVYDSLEFIGTYPIKGVEITISAGKDNDLIVGNAGGGNSRIAQQPCAFMRLWNLTNQPIEVVFSDSLAPANECDPMPESFRKRLRILFYGWVELEGKNLLLPPMSIGVRRSITRGEISWFLRDPLTNETLPFSGKYSSIYVEQ